MGWIPNYLRHLTWLRFQGLYKCFSLVVCFLLSLQKDKLSIDMRMHLNAWWRHMDAHGCVRMCDGRLRTHNMVLSNECIWIINVPVDIKCIWWHFNMYWCPQAPLTAERSCHRRYLVCEATRHPSYAKTRFRKQHVVFNHTSNVFCIFGTRYYVVCTRYRVWVLGTSCKVLRTQH